MPETGRTELFIYCLLGCYSTCSDFTQWNKISHELAFPDPGPLMKYFVIIFKENRRKESYLKSSGCVEEKR